MCYPFNLLAPVALPYIIITVLLIFVAGLSTSIYLRSMDTAEVPPLMVQATDWNGTVIIVGAGASGMFAAYTLEYIQGNHDYIVLEAGSDIGGRVQEINDFVNVPLDLGAEWIHVDPKVRQDLLLFENDVVTDEVISYQPQTIAFYRNGKYRRGDWVRWFYREYKFRNSTWHSYLKDYVYPHIAEHTILNAAVETIDYSQSDSITVTTRDGRSFVGDRVIVATPVTILQQQDVQFVPDLDVSRRQALDQVYMTAGLKAWIEFDTHFYPDMTFLWDAQDKLYMNALFRKPSDRNVLALFEVGESAYDRVELDDDAILKSMLAELDKVFGGNRASAHYVKHHIQNWSQQPYIKGAYSYNSYSKASLLAPLDGRVYFCGEYLAGGIHRSTVHGAALTGRSAAQQVLLDYARGNEST